MVLIFQRSLPGEAIMDFYLPESDWTIKFSIEITLRILTGT